MTTDTAYDRDVEDAAQRALRQLCVDKWMMAGFAAPEPPHESRSFDEDVCAAIVRLGERDGLDVRLWSGGDLGTEITLGRGPDGIVHPDQLG
jgi:hypothetical protein